MSFPTVHYEWARRAPPAARAPILGFAGSGQGVFSGRTPPAREANICHGSLFFFPKQGVVTNKESFANVEHAAQFYF